MGLTDQQMVPSTSLSRRRNGGWWDQSVGYEIFVRSFADSNDDGIGDLGGVLDRLDYLSWLGVDLLWLSPFFASPQRDFGYDVSDHFSVAPEYGDLDTVDELVDAAHRLGIRLLLDVVPNHTSDQHAWFQSSLQSVDDPHRGFYHWREPGPDGGPPNNWVSHFGGPAWTLDPASGQYYLHLFLPEQPDLNWSNPGVVREFDGILNFWLDRGFDGFRIGMAHGLVKNMLMPNNPLRRPLTDDMTARQVFASYDHRYDLEQDGNQEIFHRWRQIVDEHDALLMGEVYLRNNDPGPVSRYVKSGRGLHRAFYFAPTHVPWDPGAVWDAFRDGLDAAPVDLAWSPSSHDDPRAPTRFGGGDLGRRRALAYAVLLMGLPGLPFLYQGDELGLEDSVVAPEDAQDPLWLRDPSAGDSRDPSRSPMPWDGSAFGGFSTVLPWLNSTAEPADSSVDDQVRDPQSYLHQYRELLLARRTVGQQHGALRWLTARGEPIVAFLIGNAIYAVNLGDEPADLPLLSGLWDVQFSSEDNGSLLPVSGTLTLSAPEGIVLTRSGQSQ